MNAAFRGSARPLTGLAALCVCLVATTGTPGCAKKESKDPDKAAEAAIRRHRYTVRGAIVALPTPQQDLVVRHEAMPHFVAENGVMGMDTMSMDFPTVEGLALEGFKPGDPVEMDFEVDFDVVTGKLLGYRATAVRPLPEGTMLDFTPLPKTPEAAPAEPAPAEPAPAEPAAAPATTPAPPAP
jgi:hypothetical protein